MLTQTWEEEGQGFLVEFNGINLNRNEDSDYESTEKGEIEWEPELQGLRKEYDDVFANPKGLPPSRPIDHRNPLLEGTNPINVRPYK